MATFINESKSSFGSVSEVDFVFSDGSDFIFSDGSTDYVFVEAQASSGWTNDTKN